MENTIIVAIEQIFLYYYNQYVSWKYIFPISAILHLPGLPVILTQQYYYQDLTAAVF